MKKILFALSFPCLMAAPAFAENTTAAPAASKAVVYEYKQISTVESVVPGGLGRSRLLTTDGNGQLLEKELKNFYSLMGINFGNIANNDDVIVAKLNEMAEQGWELAQVTSGSNQQTSSGSSSGGLFITRYLFKKVKA